MYYLSECLIIKDENQYLLEHLEKNYQGGIEFFYIYDNESEQSVKEFLEKNAPIWLDRCKIEIFPTTSVIQIDCYEKFLKDHKSETKWCAFFDTDEIIEGNLKKLCEENDDYFSLEIDQIMHGSNGVVYADYSKTLTEQFKDHVLEKRHMIKCVSQIKYVKRQSAHHTYLNIPLIETIPTEKWVKKFKTKDLGDLFQLHHYFHKSFEEWCIKMRRGCVYSKIGWSLGQFFEENNVPDEKDLNYILKKYNLTMNSQSFGNSLYGNKIDKKCQIQLKV